MIREKLDVLLLEDNQDDEHLALRALRGCGLELSVRVARDGAEALSALGLDGSPGARARPAPDLVISDLKMPKLDGDEVLLRARADARLRDVPYVMFSSSDEAGDVERCLSHGASAYCVKPIAFEDYVACAGGIARRWLSEDGVAREPACVAG